MSFLDKAKEIKAAGFDAKEDSVNKTQEDLPEGNYQVILEGSTYNMAPSGWEQIGFSFKVLDGEFAGRIVSVRHGLQETWVKKDGSTMNLGWQVDITLKFFMKAMALVDEPINEEDFLDGIAMEQALLRKSVGSMYTLVVSKYTKKDKTQNTNYDIELPESNTAAEPDFTRTKTEDLPDFDPKSNPF